MNKKQYVQKSLGYLTKGYIELMENISKKNIGIPNELIQGLSNLELMGIMHNETFPTTFNNFYNLIKIPIGKWNYEFIKESIDGLGIEEYALYQESWQESDDYACEFDEDYDEDIDVLFGAKEILRVLTSNSSTLDIEESFRDEVFYKLVKLSSEEEYKIWRDGTEHNLIRTRDFEAPGFFKGINEKALKILKDEMYEKINENTQVHRIKNKTKPVIIRCSVCGTPMERYGKKHLKCPIAKCNIRKDLLRLSLHSYNDSDIVEYNTNLRVLKYGYQTSIKFPGIAEAELCEALEKFNKKHGIIEEIRKYPAKDAADFLICFKNGDKHLIDVKDWNDSKKLAEHIDESASNDITKKKHGLEFSKAFIIAPDYLNEKYKYREGFEKTIKNSELNFHFVSSYIEELKANLKSLGENQQIEFLEIN